MCVCVFGARSEQYHSPSFVTLSFEILSYNLNKQRFISENTKTLLFSTANGKLRVLKFCSQTQHANPHMINTSPPVQINWMDFFLFLLSLLFCSKCVFGKKNCKSQTSMKRLNTKTFLICNLILTKLFLEKFKSAFEIGKGSISPFLRSNLFFTFSI